MEYKRSGFTILRRGSGFTIVELLVVVVVIGVLAAITIVSYTGISQRAAISSLQSDLINASNQLKLDQVVNSGYPALMSDANGGKGIPHSPDTTYTSYAASNTTNPQTFCVTAVKGTISYNITQESAPSFGICPILSLDATVSSSYPGNGTIWTDLSGKGYSGTLNNGVVFGSTNGGVMNFDGVNDYVDIGDYDDLPALKLGTGNWSIFSWVKPSTQTTETNIFGVRTGSDQDFRIGISSSNKLYVTWVSYPPHPSYSTTSGTNSLNDGLWHYVGAVRNGGTITLYVDGVEAGADSTVGAYNISGSQWFSRWSIGAYFNGCCTTFENGYWTGFYKGSMSNIRVYNSPLSTSDINQSFNASRARYGV